MLIQQITPPLAIHFIWHPRDTDIIPVIKKFRQYLTRDIDKPFSREINIPTFLYSSLIDKRPPASYPNKLALRDIIFLFTSKNTLMISEWKQYIENIPNQSKYYIIPVAVDEAGLSHASLNRLHNLNFIRAFEWDFALKEQYGILSLSHELYRFGLKEIDKYKKGQDSSIRLFLSHAKKGDTGLRHAETIKKFIDNSNMKRFFDANEISPGFRFDKEIENHIKDSTVIAIISDAYSSRYWCQREILSAKRECRPIVLVNSLEEYEDRVFPAATNIPCVHITAEPLDDKNILRILNSALIETIRFEHAHLLLDYYKKQQWIDSEAQIFARPPEIQQIVDILNKKSQDISRLMICYPEPPLYKEETEWTDYFKISISTPLWSSTEQQSLGLRVGLSISDFKFQGYENHHQDLDELKRFSQCLARHLLSRENTLIYGGDLRDDGFTQFILDEAMVLRDRLQVDQLFIENYLAWPLHTKIENMQWYSKYFNVVKEQKIDIPNDIEPLINDKSIYLEPNCPENRYVWSRCLTKMREESIASSDVRIFAGGKVEDYLGKLPGILEEFLISCQQNKPIFLIGGLGGLTKLLCNSILEEGISEEFTEIWQITHTSSYQDLQTIAKEYGYQADYKSIEKMILGLKLSDLAKNVGLTTDEYKIIMSSPFIDEIVHLILKGLQTIKK